MTRLGDAFTGTDRTGAYIEGQQKRAAYDETRAQTDAAMELAKQRRIEAEIKEIERLQRDRVQWMDTATLANPQTAPLGALIAGQMGGDYSNVMTGRGHAQEQGFKDVVATPAGQELGDQIVTPELRQSNLEALAPASALYGGRPGTGSPIIGLDDNGQPIYFTPPSRAGTTQPVRQPGGATVTPGTRPGQPSNQEKLYNFMVGLGVPQNVALDTAMNDTRDPAGAYLRIYTAIRSAFGSDEEAKTAARAQVEAIYGPGSIEQAQVGPIPQPPGAEEQWNEGDTVYNPQTGERLQLSNGQWVPIRGAQ
jgi:hypothetical protein